jgi:hypothetical protein
VRKWLALGLLSLAGAVEAQPLTGGLLGRGSSYSSFVTPSGCTTGSMATFLGSLTCVPGLTYAGGVLSVPGAVSALNVTVTGLPTPGSITVTPTLSQLGGITVVAGAALEDGDALSVGDGVGVVPIEFDASPGDGTTGGAVAIVFDGTETDTQIRDAVKAILDGAGRDWTTSAQAANGIGLVRATPGATGGAITEDVTAAGFTVTDWTDPTHATAYTYSLQACGADGKCTEAGAASSTATSVATLSALNYNALSWSAVAGSVLYKVRRDVGGATQGVIWSGTALTVDDTGLAGDSSAKPTHNETGRVTSGALTAGRVAIVGAGGQVDDDAGLSYDATTAALTAERMVATSYSATPKTVNITGASNATPIVVTAAAHGLKTSDWIVISGITGNTNANGFFKITRLTADTFSLQNYSTGADIVGNGAYGGSPVSVTGIVYANRILLANGTAASPVLASAASPGTGLWFNGATLTSTGGATFGGIVTAGAWAVSPQAASGASYSSYITGLQMGNTPKVCWTDGIASATADTCASRDSAGLIAFSGNTANGSKGGQKIYADSSGSYQTKTSSSELLTLSTGATTTVTSGNLAAASAIVDAIVFRVVTTITTATNYSVAITGGAAWKLIGTATTTLTGLAAGSTGVLVPPAYDAGHVSTATTLTVTTDANPGAGAVRLTVIYRQMSPPTS